MFSFDTFLNDISTLYLKFIKNFRLVILVLRCRIVSVL